MRLIGPLLLASSVLGVVPAFCQVSPSPKKYVSLRSAPDAALLKFMAPGKSEADRAPPPVDEPKNLLPDHFWDLEAKAAALALIAINIGPGISLTTDPEDKASPPIRASIAFSSNYSGCFIESGDHYFLRVDPESSYLAFAGSGQRNREPWSLAQWHDLRLLAVSYQDARKIADVIWWLNQFNKKSVFDQRRNGSSTISAKGHLVFRSSADTLFDIEGEPSYGLLLDSWQGGYTKQSFLDFSAFLLQQGLPSRIGPEWHSLVEKYEQRMNRDSPPPDTSEQQRIRDLSALFLDKFSLDQDRISFAIIAAVSAIAADEEIIGTIEAMTRIQAVLPPAHIQSRSLRQIQDDIDEITPPSDNAAPSDPFAPASKIDPQSEQRLKVLEAERAAVWKQQDSDTPPQLQHLLTLAQRQLSATRNKEDLLRLALSDDDLCDWALQHLKKGDKSLYVKALDSRLRLAKDDTAISLFRELQLLSPVRAVETFRSLPTTHYLRKNRVVAPHLAEMAQMPQEARLPHLLQLLLDPPSDHNETAELMELLAPAADPRRYPGPEVDALLLKLAQSKAGEGPASGVASVYMAIARRGGRAEFEALASLLPQSYGVELLEALAHLAQKDPQHLKPRLVEIFQSLLTTTRFHLPSILWLIWEADLRVLQPQLEKLSTRDPDEYESEMAASYFTSSERPVIGPFHVARQITALWSEPDTFTQLRLLVSLALNSRLRSDAGVIQLKRELRTTFSKLTTDQQGEARLWLDRLWTQPPEVPGLTFNLKVWQENVTTLKAILEK